MENKDFESYSIEDEEEGVDNTPARRLTMWQLVPQIMVMPGSGWEKTLKSGPLPEIATLRFLLPVALLAGGAEFFVFLYAVQQSMATVLVNAVISFCSYFLGYYMALVLAKIFMPKKAKDFPSSQYGKLLTMTGVGTLAFFRILFMALPMFDFLIEFMPLWTIFLIYRGVSISGIGIPEDKVGFSIGVMCIMVICSPILVNWIFSLFC